MSEPLRRAGWGRAGSLDVTWSIAEGSKGRRWREIVRRDGVIVHSLLYETDRSRRFAHLELSIEGALLTLHPEGDGTLHGNRVSELGIDHVRGVPFPLGSWVLIDGSPVAAAAVAWGSEGRAGAIIGVEFDGGHPPGRRGPPLVRSTGGRRRCTRRPGARGRHRMAAGRVTVDALWITPRRMAHVLRNSWISPFPSRVPGGYIDVARRGPRPKAVAQMFTSAVLTTDRWFLRAFLFLPHTGDRSAATERRPR